MTTSKSPATRFASLCAFIVLIAAVPALAQERRTQKQYQPDPVPVSADPLANNIIVAPGEDYRIGPSDIIEVLVEDAPEFSHRFRVSSEGLIALPFIGRLEAKSKTPEELSKLIAEKLRGDYLNDPQVSVTVLQINSRTYFVQGAVRRPGLYQVEGQPSLLKLVTIAGGLNENYGSTAFIIRQLQTPVANAQPTPVNPNPVNPNPVSYERPRLVENNIAKSSSEQPATADPTAKAQYELLKVNINGLLRGRFEQDVAILPGDIVHIPPTDVFFVAGEVNAPGSFPLKEGTTLRQAISLAQGPTFQAAGTKTIIFREDASSGKRQEIPIDLPAVMSGKKSDVPVQANDIIIIPNSRFKTIGGTLLRAFGVNATRLPIAY